ncbi:hypothetical protein ACI51Z_08350 [Pectobacterium carotovorum]|uniref:hypothetical protein n=1 Tax=Pectobacterium carotovorum TaxID=554 RepID=UPI0005832A73|nr:hypothetical protein [Pectobacterium carotovorum]KHS86610.1 hypothetical protein RC84_01565 [Pectobacterium carotovorum subsp. carotovorum]
MANYSDRIQRLKNRRKGSSEQLRVVKDSALTKSQAGLENYTLLEGVIAGVEGWESRATADSATRYAIGAMQSVDTRYTEICIETAKRIENQLSNKLTNLGYTLEFELQGSVPLDIHIKGFSDVDILVIDQEMLRYARDGIRASSYTPTTKDSVSILRCLRIDSKRELELAFPKTFVDDSGSKSLRITGGSLQREVDVVPAIWWDTVQYQQTMEDSDRGVAILDIVKNDHIYNSPFVHIKRIREKCDASNGGLRKSIRLLKNIKADSEAEGQIIDISSYDIASIMYHADAKNLSHNEYYELAVLGETQRWLNSLLNNKDHASQLEVPNGTRKIFENTSQFIELKKLAVLVDTLVDQILEERNLTDTLQRNLTISQLLSMNSVY